MARLKVGNDVMQVRFADGTFDRIAKVCGNRSEFIRNAVEAALGGGGLVPAVPVGKVCSENKKISTGVAKGEVPVGGLRPDAAVLLVAIGKKRMTPRQAEQAMGWLGLRYIRAEKELLQSGAAQMSDGVLVHRSE